MVMIQRAIGGHVIPRPWRRLAADFFDDFPDWPRAPTRSRLLLVLEHFVNQSQNFVLFIVRKCLNLFQNHLS